jgi:hypothetical protein
VDERQAPDRAGTQIASAWSASFATPHIRLSGRMSRRSHPLAIGTANGIGRYAPDQVEVGHAKSEDLQRGREFSCRSRRRGLSRTSTSRRQRVGTCARMGALLGAVRLHPPSRQNPPSQKKCLDGTRNRVIGRLTYLKLMKGFDGERRTGSRSRDVCAGCPSGRQLWFRRIGVTGSLARWRKGLMSGPDRRR